MQNYFQCPQDASFPIIQGEDVTVPFPLTVNGKPYDLTGVTEIEVLFPSPVTPTNLNGVIEKTLTDSGGVTITGAPNLGVIAVVLSVADTKLLTQGNQGVEVRITGSDAKITILQLLNGIQVEPSLFPTV